MNQDREAVIVAYGRSAVGKTKNGGFCGNHPVDWAAQVLNGVLDKLPQLDKKEIGDVIVGCARPENRLNKNVARLIVLRAGLPESVCGVTVNRFCASSLQAIADCAYAITAGGEDVMVAGGIEQMSMKLTRAEDDDNEWLTENCEGAYIGMGLTAEKVADAYGITREEMDRFALESHRKADAAQKAGFLNRSIIPVTTLDEEGNERTVSTDEGIRPDTTLEKMASLKTPFKENGKVTAATSSQTSDGVSFIVMMSMQKAKELGVKPIARLKGFAVSGCDPTMMGLGPVYAVPKVMKKTGMTIDQMDVIELNEAFAAQAIPCIRELQLPEDKVNPWGGAIALGHPMGATGGILTCKALDYLQEYGGDHALITMCIGGGMGAAGIFEMIKG